MAPTSVSQRERSLATGGARRRSAGRARVRCLFADSFQVAAIHSVSRAGAARDKRPGVDLQHVAAADWIACAMPW